MSFWTKFRNAVTAPFEVVPNFASDIFGGKNFFDSVAKASVAGYAATDGGKSVLVSTDFGKKVSAALDAPTLGFSSAIQQRAELVNRVNAGGTVTKKEVSGELMNDAKYGAIAYGGSLAAGAAPAGASAGTTFGYGFLGAKATAGLIKNGDVGGALNTFGAGIGIPDSLVDSYNYANELIKNYKPGEVKYVGPPTSEGYGSNDSGYSLGGMGGIPPALLALAAVAAAIAYKAAKS